ncbi:MAG: hypothetical protein LBQ57_06685 [Spirochaetales bacterium]|jgi:hypothetical protein|nr:hypothetical protein [Spirochaetales bacterium]
MKISKGLYIFLLLCGFLRVSFPAFGQEEEASGGFFTLDSLAVFHDTLWLGNSDNDSAPSPIMSQWGFSLTFHVSQRWYFAPELGLYYGLEYFYRDGRAFPAEIEYADAVKTLDIFAGFPVFYKFSPDDDFSLFAGTGPAFSFKIPMRTYGKGSAGDVGGYFLENYRFVHWEFTAIFEWNFFSQLAFCVRPRVIVPLYRLWDGEGAPIYDGLMAGVGFGLRLKL